MMGVALLLEVLAIVVAADPQLPGKTFVVADRAAVGAELKQRGIRFEGLFTATLAQAESARGALPAHVKGELTRTSDVDRRDDLRAILAKAKLHDWNCGGFRHQGERFLFCSFVRRSGAGPGGPGFATAHGGGLFIVYHCRFRLRDRRISALDWDAE